MKRALFRNPVDHSRYKTLAMISSLILLAAMLGGPGMLAAQGQPTATAASTDSVPTAYQSGPSTSEPTAEPTVAATEEKPLIQEDTVEMLFPVMVHFWLVVNAKDSDLKSVTIRLSQPNLQGGIDTTIPLKLPEEGRYINDSISFFNHLWELTPVTAPRPFTIVKYEWAIETTDGRQATRGGEFVFQDTLATAETPVTAWHFIEGKVSLYSHNPELALNIVQAGVLRAYDRLEADTRSVKSYSFVIYDPEYNFCLIEEGKEGAPDSLFLASRIFSELKRPCDPANAVNIYEKYGFAVVRRPSFAIDQLQDRLIAIIAGDAFDSLWRSAKSPSLHPTWFREGLIQFYRLVPRSQALAVARTAGRANALLPLSVLANSGAEGDADTVRLWRAQSYLLVMYLAARFGAGAPLNVALRIRDGFSFDGIFTTFYGLSLSAFYDDWQAWLFTDAAQNALRWTPYSALTPTPRATATPYPTITPTSDIPTLTRTPRPTITQGPGRTITPVPTRPTNTPLPPGAFNTRTPTPTPEPEEVEPGPLQSFLESGGAIIVGVVIGLVLIVGGVLLMRRRARGRR